MRSFKYKARKQAVAAIITDDGAIERNRILGKFWTGWESNEGIRNSGRVRIPAPRRFRGLAGEKWTYWTRHGLRLWKRRQSLHASLRAMSLTCLASRWAQHLGEAPVNDEYKHHNIHTQVDCAVTTPEVARSARRFYKFTFYPIVGIPTSNTFIPTLGELDNDTCQQNIATDSLMLTPLHRPHTQLT